MGADRTQSADDTAQTGQGPSLFAGYPLPTSNTTYTPNHYFDVVLPHSSRGVVRLVGYMLRRVLGWSNPDGTPQQPQVRVSYVELITDAGISRGAIREAIDEAIAARFIQCVSAGQRNVANQIGGSSMFELCWDERDQYVTNPSEFQGFFSGNGNLTYIPNAFFDHTVRNESLAVVRVVGAIIRHSIGFQTKHGFRRQEVSLSFDDLLRFTGLGSRTSLSEALKSAIANNHVTRLSEGVFGNGQQVKAKYGIRWNTEPTPPLVRHQVNITVETAPTVQKVDQENIEVLEGDSSKSGPGTVQKVDQGTVQKVDQERFKKWTSIEITNLNNKKQQQQKGAAAAAVGGESFAMLEEVGFDANAARELAERHPLEIIRAQVAWLPKRQATKNRLGLLRRAIEENWPAPDGEALSATASPGEVFAWHYYAGYQGIQEPTTPPFAKDAPAAQGFLENFGLDQDLEAVAEHGRAFGKLVRAKHQGDPKAKPFLSTAILMFGTEFGRLRQQKASAKHQKARQTAQDAHRRANWPSYLRYLGEEEKTLQQANTGLYGAFQEEREKSFQAMRQFKVDPTRFQTEEARLLAFAEFFASHPEHRVLGFWDWDAQKNPARLTLEASNA